MADPTSPYPEMTPEQLATLSQQLGALNSGLMSNNVYGNIGGFAGSLGSTDNYTRSYEVPENYGNPKNKVYQLSAWPNEKIRLVGLDGTVYYEGVGDTGAKEAAALVQSFGKQFGPGATWKLQKQAPGADQAWNTVSQDTVGKQKTTALNAFANVALPVIGSIFGPLGAMAGSALNSGLQNKNSAQALKDAAIAGASAFVGGKIGDIVGPTIGTAVGNAANAIVPSASQAVTSGLSNAVGQTIAHLPGDFVITAATNPLINAITQGAVNAGATGLTSAGINSALNTGLKSGLSDLGTQPAAPPTETVAPTEPAPLGTATGAPTATNASPIDELVVTAAKRVPGLVSRLANLNPLLSAGLALPSLIPSSTTNLTKVGETPPENEITVTANKLANTTTGLSAKQAAALAALGGGAALGGLSTGSTTPAAGEPTPEDVLNTITTDPTALTPAELKAITDSGGIASYLKAHGLDLAAAAAGAAGGGTSTAGGTTGVVKYEPGTMPGTPGSLPSYFHDPLPAPSGIFANMKPRNMAGTNFETYGQGPEQSFFENVPVRTLAHGGSSNGPRKEFAVRGVGTGRSDDIPAVLSDGEYVMDAETVALLGDGSSKAGAEKLDKFRVNLRKHKGRNLARGKFSVDAKSPEKYLSGGRT